MQIIYLLIFSYVFLLSSQRSKMHKKF
ncbi:CcmD family protein [Ruminococcus bromii]